MGEDVMDEGEAEEEDEDDVEAEGRRLGGGLCWHRKS